MPRAWRIVKKKFADHAFDGEGSRLYGSRWTSPGLPVSFAAESLSLAVLEVLVHLQSSARSSITWSSTSPFRMM